MKALYVDFALGRIVALSIAKTVSRRFAFAPFAPLRFREVPVPAIPGPRWIKVRNVRCGLCASDLHFAFMDIDVGCFPAAAPGVRLITGNLNGDLFVDVLDFGIFIGQTIALGVGSYPGGGDTPCMFMGAHADEGFSSVEQASALISAYLPHRPKPRDLSGLSKNLRLGEDGRYRWHWDPRFVASVRETRQEHNLEDFEKRLTGLTLPLHLVRGRMSELVPEDAVRSFLAAAPTAHYSDIADAGHMVAGDRNDAFCEAVENFLAKLDAGR